MVRIDVLRALLISLLLFFPTLNIIYSVIFINYLLNGFYYPVKQAAIQTLIKSEKRIQFISITQTYSYTTHFVIPFVAGLLLLLSLSIYDVLATLVITDFAKNIPNLGFPNIFSFSMLLGLFSSLTAIATILASLVTKIIPAKKIKLCAKTGLIFLISGLVFWACPIAYKYCWIFFICGTFLIGFGLSFSRYFLYTVGYELTEKNLFVQIVSSADAIARLWQSCVATATVTLSTLFPASGIVLVSCFIMSFALMPIKNLMGKLNEHSDSIDTLQEI